MSKIESILDRMGSTCGSYAQRVSRDESLSEDFEQCQNQWLDLQTRIGTMASQLEQYPEKWKQYESQ